MIKTLPLFLMLFALPIAHADVPPISNALNRDGLDLGGKWAYIVDPYNIGYFNFHMNRYDRVDPPVGGFSLDAKPKDESSLLEYSFDDLIALDVPGDWNSQDDKLFFYEGSIWYRRYFNAPEERDEKRHFIYFGAVNYQADVYLNGRKLGTHEGGFTPFQFEVTDRLQDGENFLVLRVNNNRREGAVPGIMTDWWNYGGITREVRLIEVPKTFVADHSLKLLRGGGDRVETTIRLDGPDGPDSKVQIQIPALGVKETLITDLNGIARGELLAKDLVRWSPETPQLYEVILQAGEDRVTERIGFRTIETQGSRILLNGEPIFLRGICVHEENPIRGGRAFSEDDARLLLGWVKELGGNYARLAHYPHNEHMARVADEMGIMLWEEIPVYWAIDWENPAALVTARDQLSGLIERDKNRASVVIWSVANETPQSEPRNDFLRTLIEDVRKLDDSRLVSAALLLKSQQDGRRTLADPLADDVDIISFNMYVGWYLGMPDYASNVLWDLPGDKPVIASELGGGALAGKRGPRTHRWTEEFQAWIYEESLPMFERIDALAGLSPWILADFRSPRRQLYGIQDFWNRKGLIGDNGQRKKAFYVLQEYYHELAEQESSENPADE